VSIRFDQGFSDRLPYPDASFDRVFSSFMRLWIGIEPHHLDVRMKTLDQYDERARAAANVENVVA
jgi:hypothetical protein